MKKTLILCLLLLAAFSVQAQETVYVAPAPEPGDPAYVSYQLKQLADSLRRNELDSARLDAFRTKAEVNRRLLEELDRAALESLVQLAEVLETAGSADQKEALAAVIRSKLDEMLPATLRSYPEGTTLVIATPGFPWAADHVAGVIGGRPVALESSRSEAMAIAEENPNVIGVVDVEVNVYQAYETVRAVCYGPDGAELWSKRRLLNSGGGPQKLAQDMVGALLKKVGGKSCP